MELSAKTASLDAIQSMRELYRQEMDCQIIHDSIHSRPGWTSEYLLHEGATPVGYGSVAIAGPWKDHPTLYEFYVLTNHRNRLFDLFATLLAATAVHNIETQSNDSLLTVMLHAYAHNVASQSIIFHDKFTTSLAPHGTSFRRATDADFPDISADRLLAHGVVEIDGALAGKGGILFHYNPPYGDIYMEVSEPYRQRGLGSYLVQELKRVCYELGKIPAARCNPKNIPSRQTLQKAGFVPCGHILSGTLLAGAEDAQSGSDASN